MQAGNLLFRSKLDMTFIEVGIIFPIWIAINWFCLRVIPRLRKRHFRLFSIGKWHGNYQSFALEYPELTDDYVEDPRLFLKAWYFLLINTYRQWYAYENKPGYCIVENCPFKLDSKRSV